VFISKVKIRGLVLLSAAVALTMVAADHLVLGQIRQEAVRQATLQQESAIATFWEILKSRGSFRVRQGSLWVGDRLLNGNNELTDRVLRSTGRRATIFLQEKRIATNVLLPDGRRALGTRLSGPAYDALYRRGVPYRGVADILGTRYFTAYDPIRDAQGRVIGAIFVGVKEEEHLAGYDRINLKIRLINGALAAVFLLFACLLLAERRRSQEATEKQLSFLRALSDTIPSPIFAKDAAGRYNHCNQAFLSFLGLAREELIGKTVHELWPAEVADRYQAMDRELMERTGSQVYEYQAWHADGTLRDVIYNKATYWDERGVVGGIVGVILDITERKAAEAELKNAYQRMADILEFLPDATLVVDCERRVVTWNRALEELTGVPKEEMIGRGDQAYALPLYGLRREVLIDLLDEGEEEIAHRYLNAKKTGSTIFGEVHFPNYRGEDRTFSCAASALMDGAGNRIGGIETMRDVTELRRAQEQRSKLEAQLHHSRMMGLLMAQLSHDLKTPLTPLFALLPLIAGKTSDPALSRMLEICRQSAGQIQALADKSLQLVRLSSPTVPPQLIPVELAATADCALAELAPLLAGRGVSCLNLIGRGVEVLGSREDLLLLFKSLLDNAARYAAREGRVELTALLFEGELRVAVRDDGIGVAAEHLSLIFSEFFKADPARHDLSTQGLGLAICRRIVANHGGRIWADSPGPGLGTTISFTLKPAPG